MKNTLRNYWQRLQAVMEIFYYRDVLVMVNFSEH